ncbi:MAG: hypothetical protein OHK93_008093, partial [Ramalina farinacea]|nr:hypothetical protein [Ramalina farinacea]
MPWSRLRPVKSSDAKRLRRYSTLDAALPQSNEEFGTATMPMTQPRRSEQSPSSLRPSFEPPQAQRSANADTPPRASPLESNKTNPRFSMLAKRHVSDPQISKTARDQAHRNAPPLPP